MVERTVSDVEICGWTIYVHPLDFPEHYAVRMWVVVEGAVVHMPIAGLYDTLEEARFDIPVGLYQVDRDPDDDPVIVESWL